MITTIDGSGRLVLPKQIRQQMRIDYETVLVVGEKSEDTIILRVARSDAGDKSQSSPEKKLNNDNGKSGGEGGTLKQFLTL